MKILLISYAFPPSTEVGGKRIVRFCRYLPSNGIDPIVLTVDQAVYEAVDPSYAPPAGVQVVRTSVGAGCLDHYVRSVKVSPQVPSQQPLHVPSSGSNGKRDLRRRVAEFVRPHILGLVWIPDSHRNWHEVALKEGSRLTESQPIQAIVSSGPPHSAHLIARDLKRKYGVPWIMDFRDAWMCNPWRELLGFPRWRDWTDAWLEKGCVRLADAVVCITDEMRADFVRAYPDSPASKFVTITNGFDVAELSPADPEPAPQQRRLILHLGTLYGDRKIDNFCQAISRLVAQGDVDPSSFKVLFAGVMEKSIVDAARQSAPELVASGAIEFRSRMPWEEAQRLLRRSSTALLIQGHHQQGLPAKLFEYIAAGKRIFAVVDGGAVGRLLDELKIGCWADPDDVSAMAARLREFMEAPALSPDEVRARGQQYDFRSLAEHLAELISAVAVQPVRS
jgi:glycosyltransferase involved in cell wall biosynthesis